MPEQPVLFVYDDFPVKAYFDAVVAAAADAGWEHRASSDPARTVSRMVGSTALVTSLAYLSIRQAKGDPWRPLRPHSTSVVIDAADELELPRLLITDSPNAKQFLGDFAGDAVISAQDLSIITPWVSKWLRSLADERWPHRY
jgi:hypothetical protein